MNSVLVAEPAILFKLKPVRIVLFVFDSVIIPLLALAANQGNFNSHFFGTSI